MQKHSTVFFFRFLFHLNDWRIPISILSHDLRMQKNSRHTFIHICLEMNSCLDMMFVLTTRCNKNKADSANCQFCLHASQHETSHQTVFVILVFVYIAINFFVICANLPIFIVWERIECKYAFFIQVITEMLLIQWILWNASITYLNF